MAEVVLKNVSKVFPASESGGGAGWFGRRKNAPADFVAVKDVSLSIADGEFVVLVGPSGCGKTTTLRMIAGLEEITSGSISIGGRVVNDVEPKDRDIAMVFQNYALYPHMNVYDNMAFALKMRKVPRQEIDLRVRQTAQTLGIEQLLARKPKALSGGQKQRVAVGRAIVREPKAFLFDEPLSNLDARMRVGTRAELKALHQRLGTTTVYVTHDQEEAMTLGDRVVVMSGGLVQQAGPPLEVYNRPANRFVASFVGTPPMNLLDGAIEQHGGAATFVETAAAGAPPSGRPPLRLRLPARMCAPLTSFVGRPIVLGVRPQTLSEPVSGAAAADAWIARVDVVEPLGDAMDLACTTPGGNRLVARVPARAGIRAGQDATLAVDAEKVHVFEPGEFGLNLTLTPLTA